MATYRNKKEIPIGALDGVNTLFETSATYEPLTVFVYRNGQLMPKEFVTELGGKLFEVFDPFESDEDIYVKYISKV
jgi:hypothetical protein